MKRRLIGVNVANDNVHSSHCIVVRLARIILGLGGEQGRRGWEGDRKVETINLPPYTFKLGRVQLILDLSIVKVG